MKTKQRIAAFLAAALGAAAPWPTDAATPVTYFGMAVVIEANSTCLAAKWTVGQQISVNYREQIGLTPPATELRFSDSTRTVIVRQHQNTSWGGPSGAIYDGETSGLEVDFATHYSGHAAVSVWTSSKVTNARYMPSAEFTNWANVTGCTLKLWASMVQR